MLSYDELKGGKQMKLKAFKQIGLMLVAGVAGLGVGAAVMYKVHPASAASETTNAPVLNYVEKVEATCTKAGTKAYWEKDGKYYVDQAGTQEINADDLATWRIIAPTHHLYLHKKDVSCGATFAHEAYYECIDCHKYFSDANCQHEIKDLNEVKLEQVQHILVWVPEEAPTACDEEGHYGHYACKTCHQTFSDKEGLHPYDPVYKMQHDVHKVPAHAATCDQAGNIEYYHCDHCGKNFQESACDHELKDVSVKPLGHNCVLVEEESATCDKAGIMRHYHCTRCGKNFADPAGTEPLDSIIIEQLSHDYHVTISHENRLNEPCYCIENGRVSQARVQYKTVCSRCGDIGVSVWYTAYAKLDNNTSSNVVDDCANYETHVSADGKEMIDEVVYKIKASDLADGKVKIMIKLPGIYSDNSQCRNATSGAGYGLKNMLQTGFANSKLLELDPSIAYWYFDWEGDGTYEQVIHIVIE